MRSSSASPLGGRRDGSLASEAVEDYVRAIGRTARGPRRIASTTEVAGFLAVNPASVSSMFKKLARLGLVVYVPYRGASLTSDGRRLALSVTRRHHLVQAFLVHALRMPPERVRDEADRLEHHISPELEALMAEYLREPPHDPRGEAAELLHEPRVARASTPGTDERLPPARAPGPSTGPQRGGTPDAC